MSKNQAGNTASEPSDPQDGTPSSVIVETKHIPTEENPLPTTDPRAVHPQAVTTQQSEFVQTVFAAVKAGSISEVEETLTSLGVTDVKDIAKLVDDSNMSQNALFTAVRIKDNTKALSMTQYLIEKCQCDVSLEDTFGQTSLFYAARDNKPQLITLVLQSGAKVNHADSFR
jgi:hypothetical protein